MEEIWKDIKDYEGIYQVSNQGRVRSLDRTVKYVTGAKRKLHGKIIKVQDDGRGYSQVRLYDKNRKGKTIKVHKLVATNFINNPKKYKEVNHKNGVKDDNSVGNLEWTTRKRNIAHAISNKLINNSGQDNSLAKLTNDDARVIRELYSTGEYTQLELGEIYEVDRSQISLIVNNKAYRERKRLNGFIQLGDLI